MEGTLNVSFCAPKELLFQAKFNLMWLLGNSQVTFHCRCNAEMLITNSFSRNDFAPITKHMLVPVEVYEVTPGAELMLVLTGDMKTFIGFDPTNLAQQRVADILEFGLQTVFDKTVKEACQSFIGEGKKHTILASLKTVLLPDMSLSVSLAVDLGSLDGLVSLALLTQAQSQGAWEPTHDTRARLIKQLHSGCEMVLPLKLGEVRLPATAGIDSAMEGIAHLQL
ncbi:uncharacterized protein LOC133391884 [Anopheles gambiae]|uniref:uncharacterized protein LOC133391884 n=1 Tax=Anopheles gambiae TaxID=7165 RepID=UPI002AC95EAB|nr:uncharacterized protein LOC133391884 [Anopheles gambiae]